MFLITFRCEDEPDALVSAAAGENLLKVARRAGIAVNAPCSGNGSCGKCLVQLVADSPPREGHLDSPKSFYISDTDYVEGWRLACLSRVAGDATVRLRD